MGGEGWHFGIGDGNIAFNLHRIFEIGNFTTYRFGPPRLRATKRHLNQESSMVLSKFILLCVCTVGVLAVPAAAGENLDGYVTKDGELPLPLEIRDMQGGFPGYKGIYVKVDKQGK